MVIIRVIQGVLNVYMPFFVSSPRLVTIKFTCDAIIEKKNKHKTSIINFVLCWKEIC